MADDIEMGGSAPVPTNPLDPAEPLKQPPPGITTEPAHGVQPPLPGDSATTRAEKVERHGLPATNSNTEEFEVSASKRRKLDNGVDGQPTTPSSANDVRKGVAPIKQE